MNAITEAAGKLAESAALSQEHAEQILRKALKEFRLTHNDADAIGNVLRG